MKTKTKEVVRNNVLLINKLIAIMLVATVLLCDYPRQVDVISMTCENPSNIIA